MDTPTNSRVEGKSISKIIKVIGLSTLMFNIVGQTALAQQPKSYIDGQGREVYFPLGELSFADAVVSFDMGSPAPQSEPARQQQNIIGEPINASLSLGCSGTVIVQFVDNTLINIEGPDLYIFEIGPEVEATNLEISSNGDDWIDVGPISGSTAAIDIAEFTSDDADRVFQFVRLTDRNINCRAGNYSGADIDAVGAIGGALRVQLSGEVLFDFDSAKLRVEALPEIDRVIERIENYPGATIRVEGHTDARGSDSYNLDLSNRRALSVADYLESKQVNTSEILAKGLGEAYPVDTNNTDEGSQLNRRVELIIIPATR